MKTNSKPCVNQVLKLRTNIVYHLVAMHKWLPNLVLYQTGKVWDELIYPFPNFNDATVEI